MDCLQVRFSIPSEDLIKSLFAITIRNICNCHLDEKARRGRDAGSRGGPMRTVVGSHPDYNIRNKKQNSHSLSLLVHLLKSRIVDSLLTNQLFESRSWTFD